MHMVNKGTNARVDYNYVCDVVKPSNIRIEYRECSATLFFLRLPLWIVFVKWRGSDAMIVPYILCKFKIQIRFYYVTI